MNVHIEFPRSRILTAALAAMLPSGCDAPDGDDLAGDDGAVDLRADDEEPNDAPDQATPIVLGVSHHGTLAAGDQVDNWRFHITVRTYINVFLGEIPAGSDYDLALIKDGAVVWKGNNSDDQPEMAVRFDVQPGTYVLQVTAVDNPQPNKSYRVRAAYTAISRAMEWENAAMPYCGAPNGGTDILCGGTCIREGDAAKPEWDPYRSDCSGYISWAWKLDPPGLTTWQLPQRFSPIAVGELRPGDILVHPSQGDGHAFLFSRWLDQAAGRAEILEELMCDTMATKREVTFTDVAPNATTTQYWWDGTQVDFRDYTPMRFNMP